MPVAADAVAALEAVDGKTFVTEDLQRAQSCGAGADQAVAPLVMPPSIAGDGARERELIDYAAVGNAYGCARA